MHVPNMAKLATPQVETAKTNGNEREATEVLVCAQCFSVSFLG